MTGLRQTSGFPKSLRSIRTRLSAAILLAVLIPLVSTGLYGNWVTSHVIEEKVIDTTRYDLRQRAARITAYLDDLHNHVLYLSRLPSLTSLLEARAQGDTADVARWRERLAADYLNAAGMHPVYYQLRYIAEDGHEWVRVDSDGVTPFIVPPERLQDKADRYYFTETMRLAPDEVYVSPLDLNQEFGQIEVPYVPVIRYALPVFLPNGQRAGIVILNVFAEGFLRFVHEEVGPNHVVGLADEEGYYLAHPDATRTWGGPRDLNTGQSLRRDYPTAWERIRAGLNTGLSNAEDVVRIGDEPAAEAASTPWKPLVAWMTSMGIGPGRILMYTTISPGVARSETGHSGGDGPRWVLFCEQPTASLFASLWSFRLSAASALIAAGLGALLMAVLLARSLTMPLMALREGARRLQRGEPASPVTVHSRDEIGELAVAFNEMAATLQRSLEQLSLLNQAGNHIAGQLEEPQVLQAIVRALQALFNADYYVVRLVERDVRTGTQVVTAGDATWAPHSQSPAVLAVLQSVLDAGSWHVTTLPPADDEKETGRQGDRGTGGQRESPSSSPSPPLLAPLSQTEGPAGYLCCAPLCMGPQQQGLLELYGRHPDLGESATGNLLAALAVEASIALEKARLYERLVDHEQQLAALLERLVTAQEEERRMMAYDLHDGLVQMLVGIQLHVGNFVATWKEAPEEAEGWLQKSLDALTTAISEVRRLIEGLRPMALDDLGLAEALRQYAKDLGAEADWEIDFTVTPPVLRAPAAVETAAFRIAQEALTNVRRHSAARHVQVMLAIQNGRLVVEVRDDGQGFDLQTLDNDRHFDGVYPDAGRAQYKRKLGLAGMEERAHLLGGTYHIESIPGQGTRVRAEIPCQ